MARPQKTGLDYFPLDVDIDQDDKIALIEAQHGIKGFAIVIKLFMKIYKNGYFYEWTEKEQLLFSRRVNVNINEVNVIINDCIKWGLFNINLYKKYHILTSNGVQRRFLEAVGRRQKVKIDKKYLLLDDETINVYKNLVIVNINDSLNEVNDDINPQSKEKKSKVKESKGENKKQLKTEPLSFPTPIHEEIYKQLGDTVYKAWFNNTKITDNENIIEIKTNLDLQRVTVNRYVSDLDLGKKIEVS